MNLEEIYHEIEVFSKESHGSSDYHKDELYVRGQNPKEYAPLRYLKKKLESLESESVLIKLGFIFDSLEMVNMSDFTPWFESQFSRKLLSKDIRRISILHLPNNKTIFESLGTVHKHYEILRTQQILLNAKKLPVQIGEWYAKCIFGLKQIKSTSQRGFDFFLGDKRVEVKVHWGDTSSPKGVKVRKSLVELSDFTILIFINSNFMIREICFLDSDYVVRKFSDKGHTIFLKDSEISQYFFSKNATNFDKVVNTTALMKFCSPQLAMKLTGKI